MSRNLKAHLKTLGVFAALLWIVVSIALWPMVFYPLYMGALSVALLIAVYWLIHSSFTL